MATCEDVIINMCADAISFYNFINSKKLLKITEILILKWDAS